MLHSHAGLHEWQVVSRLRQESLRPTLEVSPVAHHREEESQGVGNEGKEREDHGG